MRLIGNIIWLIFGGFTIALEYLTASIILFISIIGIPFGVQTFKLGLLALWPFGTKITREPSTMGCFSVTLNIIWFLFAGLWIAITHIFWGILLSITIVGIPFGKQHFKMSKIALMPFGLSYS